MPKRIYFDYLDSLRFFAFFVVFIGHAAILFPISADWFYSLYRSVFSNGSYGVNFFFILSGFLISYLLMTEKKDTGRVSVRTFYLKRVLRIWPLYFVVFVSAIFILPFIVRALGADYIAGSMKTFPNLGMTTGETGPWWFLFFVGNFYRAHEWGPTPFALGVLWSVCIEEQFYLFWPWIVKKFKHKGMLYVALLVMGISLIYKALYINDANLAYYGSLSVAMDLATGCVLGIFYFRFEHEVRAGWGYLASSLKSFSMFKKTLSKGWVLVKNNMGKMFEANKNISKFLSIFLTVILFLAFIGYIIFLLMQGGNGLIYDTLRLLKRPVLDVFFAIILLAFLLRKPRELVESPNTDINTSASAYKSESGEESHMWYNRFTYLGRISYGLYAYHAIFLILILAIFNHYGMGPNDVSILLFSTIFIISLILTILASHYSYKYMEGPFIRLRGKIQEKFKVMKKR